MSKASDYQAISDAAKQLQGHSIRTPVLSSERINEYLGTKVLFKCENLQHIGAFKFRGAFNAISRLSEQQILRGVIAYSSGNHAQAVARVCQLLGIQATIVMPDNAPLIKRNATEHYGATIIEYDPDTELREELTEKLKKDQQLTLIPPFNHPHIIAGQGTAALELMQEYPEIQQLLVPCGGGGLLSGSALAAKGINPDCKVTGVEPELADDAAQSFKLGKIVTIDYPHTIADGTRTLSLGDITFDIIKKQVDTMETVSEHSIKQAVSLLFYWLKQVVEPSGALGLAAILEDKCKGADTIGVILSGGNIDGETLSSILTETSMDN